MAFWNRWKATRGIASRPYQEGGFMVPRWTAPPERNTEEWVQAFRTNPRLAVVERIASDLSAAAGKLYRIGRDGEEQELDEHAFLDFWDNPNPLHEMSNAALWRLLLRFLLPLPGEFLFCPTQAAGGGILNSVAAVLVCLPVLGRIPQLRPQPLRAVV